MDTTIKIKDIHQNNESAVWNFEMPKNIKNYIVEKGSICLDGISLTISNKFHDSFSVALIPHTLQITTWKNKKIGDSINVEIDMMAKYLENFIGNKNAGFNSIDSALEDIINGKAGIVVDSEDRENEGDLVIASELITPDTINFMAKEGRGLICVSITKDRAKHLDLVPMERKTQVFTKQILL